MPEIPAEAVKAAMARRADLLSDRPDPMVLSDETLTRLMLEAAAPILAEAVAQKILVHMESRGPRKPRGALEPAIDVGRDYRAWRRHFGIAARVAAGAFWTGEDKLRLAAEALERGEFLGCNPPEVP